MKESKKDVNSSRRLGIFFSAVIVAVGGIIYELIIASVSSYLIGDSVLQFSLTIGIVLFGMGIGSFLVRYFHRSPEEKFVLIEILLGVIGGTSVTLLHYTYGYFNDIFYLVFILLSLCIGILIGFEVPLMLDIISSKENHFKSVSNILSLDYIGALIASVLFPLFLLPTLGVERVAYLTGISNILIALLVFVSFRTHIKLKKFLGALSVVFLTGLVTLFYWTSSNSTINSKLYRDKIILETQSKYQRIAFTKRKDDLRFFLNGNLQFSSIDEYRYHETLVHPVIQSARNRENVLILGGGDGLAVREVVEYEDVEDIKVVDLDPEVTKLGKEFDPLVELNDNSLKESRVEVINEDAFKYLEDNTQLFNVIIADLPDPNNEALNKLYTKEFYSLISRSLTKDGVFITQAGSPFFSNNSYWIIGDTLSSELKYSKPLRIYVPSFGEWGFFVASNIELEQIWLDEINTEGLDLRYVNNDILKNMENFSPDIQKKYSGERINQNTDPILYREYIREYREIGF